MTQVFLSHSSADAKFATHLAADLRSAGIPVWKAPESILDGEEWVSAIERGLTTSTHFLLLQSPAAVDSKWVKFEFNCALALVHQDKMRIIPIDYQPCAAPLFWTQFQQVAGIHDDYHATLLRMIIRLHEEQPVNPPKPTSRGTTIDVPIQSGVSESMTAASQNVVYPGQPIEPPLVIPTMNDEPANVQQTAAAQPIHLAQATLSSDASDILSILPPPFEWCEIPAGQVTLGDNAGIFEVQPFWMAKYPITYAQFQIFLEADDGFYNPRWWEGLAADAMHKDQPGNQQWKIDTHPRECVSWWDAIAFCQWLNARLSLPPIPGDLSVQDLALYRSIRLPTDWEWQRAAQGPDGRKFPWGNEYILGYANINEIADKIEGGIYWKKTTPVDSYPQSASPYGVQDMIGNVWEWCLNEYQGLETIGLGGATARVLRGSSWGLNQDCACVSYRGLFEPDGRYDDNGFRVACSLSRR